MKKIWSIALTIVLLISAMPTDLFSITANAATSGVYTYTVSNREAMITRCDTSVSGILHIPSTLGGYPVTSIGESAFSFCSSLTEIVIPESVTRIEEEAFYYCLLLEKVTIPKGVASIENNTFRYCTHLSGIVIPNSVTSIGSSAFSDCSSLTEVVIPNSVTSIGSSAFLDCSSLTEVVIPNSVTSIGSSAFLDCSSLTEVVIPNSVTSIGEDAFKWCNSLEGVYISDLSRWCEIEFAGIESNPLYGAENLYLDGELVTELVIEEGVTRISEYAFYGYRFLTEIIIPKSVSSIGENSFSYSGSLKSIVVDSNNYFYYSERNCLVEKENQMLIIGCGTGVIPKDVKGIGKNAFSGSSLEKIMIPEGVTSIGSSAFSSCSSLAEIVIPNSVTSIGSSAFYGCDSLVEIELPNGITSIEDYTFTSCYALTKIEIPKGVTDIGVRAFAWCNHLTEIVIPESVTSIGTEAFLSARRLSDIWYMGDESKKEDIVMNGSDYDLHDATWHYNYCGDNHSYSSECDIECDVCDWTRDSDVFHIFTSTCDEVCNACGYQRVAFQEHSYTNACGTQCNVCGEVEKNSHTYRSLCDRFCDVCGFQQAAAQEHTYKNACDVDCNLCGDIRTISHTYTNICDENCDICGDEREVDHVYTSLCDESCNICNSRRTTSKEHSYTDVCDIDCNVCGESREVSHVYDNKCDELCNVCLTGRVDAHSYSDNSDVDCNICLNLRTVECHTCEGEGTTIAQEDCSACSDGISGYKNCSTCGGSGSYGTPTQQSCGVCKGEGVAEDAFGNLHGCGFCDQGQIKVYPTCYHCGGDKRFPIRCSHCNGKGKFSVNVECQTCGGEGEIKPYRISFDANGGVDEPQKQIIVGFDNTISLEQPTKDGYVFKGWKSLKDNSTVYNSGDIYNSGEDTLYAIWHPDCSECNGSGKQEKQEACKECYGTGKKAWCAACGSDNIYTRVENGAIARICRDCLKPAGYEGECDECSEGFCTVVYNCLICSGIGCIPEESRPALPPSVLSKTSNSITLKQEEGFEYSVDGINWQTDPTFMNLSMGVKYTFYQREVVNNNACKGEISEGLVVTIGIFGDFNDDQMVTDADALYLLYHTIFGDSYPIEQDCDYNKDGSVTDSDALYLLYHTIFGDSYPLN